MLSDIFDVIENALAKAGYLIMDGDNSDSVLNRDKNSDSDYEIKVSEIIK